MRARETKENTGDLRARETKGNKGDLRARETEGKKEEGDDVEGPEGRV